MTNRKLPRVPAPGADDAAPMEQPATPRAPAWLRALRVAAGFALVATVSIAVAWASRRYLLTSPRFALESVVLSGEKTRTKDALLARAGITMGENVFSIDLDAARDKMLGDPYVKDAHLSRRLPGTLFVTIDERVPAAIVSLGDQAFLVTRDGEAFKRLAIGDPSDLPVITGLRPELAETDRDAFAQAVRRALDVAVDYEQSALAAKMPLEEIHFQAGEGFSLRVGSPVTSLVLGAPPFRKKLERAARVAGELARRGQTPDAILLDNDARPDRVVARVR